MSVDDGPGVERPDDGSTRAGAGRPGQTPLWGPTFVKSGDAPLPSVPADQPQAAGPVFARPGQSADETIAAHAAIHGGPVFVKVAERHDEDHPWSWYVGLVALFVAFVAVIMLSFAVIIPATLLSSTDTTKFTDQNEHWLGLGQDVLWIAVALIVPFLFARHLRASQLGMRRPPVWWKAVVSFLVAIVLFYLIAWGYSTLLGLDDKSNSLLDKNSGFGTSITRDIAFAILYTVAAPVAEELLFRGLLFRTLRDGLSKKFRRGGVWYAAVISGVIFGGIHYTPGPINQNKYIPVLIMLGVMLALAYNFSGTIYVNIAIHAINNALATGANTHPTQNWIFVLIGIGPLLAILVTVLLSRFVRATFRSEPPDRAHPASAEPAIV